MPTLSFTLVPSAISSFHEALSCLAKFDESVTLEVSSTHLSLSTLNTSKTAYAIFRFETSTFFDTFNYQPIPDGQGQGLQGCLFLNKVRFPFSSMFPSRSSEHSLTSEGLILGFQKT